MSRDEAAARELRVLVLAPGRDGALIEAALRAAGVASRCCGGVAELCREADAGAGAVLLVEEEAPEAARPLAAHIAAAPPWSDLPVLILTQQGADSPVLASLLADLGNVTLVERPTRAPALVSAVRSALRARRRQYEIRAHLAARQAAEEQVELELAVNRILVQPGGARERLRAALALLAERFAWSAGMVWEVDADATWRCAVRWSAADPPPPWLVRASRPGSPHAELARRAGTTAAPLWLEQAPGADVTPGAPLSDGGGVASLPLPMGLAVGGVLIAHRDRAGGFPEGERQTMVRIATRLGQFIARTRAEEALRRSEANLSDFFENAPIGLHWVDADGRIVRANRTELDMLGYREDEYVGCPIADFHADPAVIADILARLSRGETLHELPAQLRARDGSLRDVRISSNVLWEHGRFVHSRCFTHDVTERNRAESLLRERTSLLHAISAGTSDLIYVKDRAGRLVLGNPALFAIIGPEEQVIGRTDLDFTPDREQARRIMATDQRVMTSGVAEVTEEEFGPPGRILTFLSTKAPYRDERGEIIGLLGISRDITERKRTEQALREADRRKDEFLAMLAHELRNPLAPIRNALQLLRLRGATGGRRAAPAPMIERQVAAAGPPGRRPARRLAHHPRQDRAAQGAASTLADVIAARGRDQPAADRGAGHELSVDAAGRAAVDRRRRRRGCAQVFANLLNNAAKYTDPGGQIALERAAAGRRQVVDPRARQRHRHRAPSMLPRDLRPVRAGRPLARARRRAAWASA